MELSTSDSFSYDNNETKITTSDFTPRDGNETEITASDLILRDGYDLSVYGLSNGLFYAFHIPAVACICLSLICAVTAIVSSFRRHHVRSFFSWTQCDRFVVYLAICDGLFNLAHGSDHAHVIITKSHVYPKALCQFYGFVTCTFVSAQNLLVAIIAVNVFVLMFFQMKPKFGRRDWVLIVFIFGLPLCSAGVVWYLGKLGPNGMFCLTDGVNGWTTYVSLISMPLLIIFVLNSLLYLLSWWKIRSEVTFIRKNLGQDRRSHDKTSIAAAKNMSLFVAAFFIQWFIAGLFGVWSLVGNTPSVIFHINTILTNLGGVLNLGVFFMVNKRRYNRQSTRTFRDTVSVNRERNSDSGIGNTRLCDSAGTMTCSLSTIAQ